MTADLFFELDGLVAARYAEGAAEHGDVLDPHQHLAGEVAVENVARLEIQELADGNGGLAEVSAELDIGVLDFFTQADIPAVVFFDAVTGHAGVEDLAQR